MLRRLEHIRYAPKCDGIKELWGYFISKAVSTGQLSGGLELVYHSLEAGGTLPPAFFFYPKRVIPDPELRQNPG